MNRVWFFTFLLLCVQFGYIHVLRKQAQTWEDIALANGKELTNAQMSMNECYLSNQDLTEKVQYVYTQNDYMLNRCTALIKQLKTTTDVLESTSRCAYQHLDPKRCGIDPTDLVLLMHQNRKADF